MAVYASLYGAPGAGISECDCSIAAAVPYSRFHLNADSAAIYLTAVQCPYRCLPKPYLYLLCYIHRA